MSQSSLSIWLKPLLRRNDAKLLKNTSSKPLTHLAVNLEQEISDRVLTVSIASARVSSIAARGVLNVVKAQAGAPTTAAMALRTADELCKCAEFVAGLAAGGARHARDVAAGTAHPTDTGLRVAVDLKPVAANISLWAHEVDVSVRNTVDQIKYAQGKYARRSSHHRASVAAGLTAVAEVARTVADVVEAHIDIAARTKSVPSVEELTLAIALATTQAALAVAEAVSFMNHRHPPPNENLGLN